MIQSIGSSNVSGASLRGIDGVSGSPEQRAGAAMTTIAGRVAATMVQELRLGGDIGQSSGKATGGDAYGVEAVADELSRALGGTPADAGRLSRALHEFTSEVASLVAARPNSETLESVSALDTGSPAPAGGSDMDRAISKIDAAATFFREDGNR